MEPRAENLSLRMARRAEANVFAEWEAQGRPYPWKTNGFLGAIESGMTIVLALESPMGVAGFAVINRDGSNGYIENWAIRPFDRGKGWGAAFMQLILSWARENKLQRITLDVDPNNTTAVHVYHKLGFRLLQKRPNAYPGGEFADVYQIKLIT